MPFVRSSVLTLIALRVALSFTDSYINRGKIDMNCSSSGCGVSFLL